MIRETIREACNLAGVPELCSRINVVWSNRLTRAVAYGGYNYHTGWGTIKISRKLFPAMKTDDSRRDTILHETAHVITNYLHPGLREKCGGHGPMWYAYATKVGCSGKVLVPTEELDATPFRRRQQRFPIRCKCGMACLVSKNKLTRMRNRTYVCTKCKAVIEV